MYQQEVKGRKISPLAGIGLIVLIVVSIMAAGILEQLIAVMTGFAYGSFVVWGLVVVEAVFIMRLNVMGSFYRLTEDSLCIDRKYGERIRNMLTIPLTHIVAVGPEAEIFKKYGNAQAYDKLTTRGCAIPVSAVAYRKDGEIKLVTFHPDEELLFLMEGQRRARAQAEDEKYFM